MLFTIEQLELIRRLRVTGIVAEQVLSAFDELEKVEGDPSTTPPTKVEEVKVSPSVYAPLLVKHLTESPSTSPQPDRKIVQTVPFAQTQSEECPSSPASMILGTSSPLDFDMKYSSSSAPRPIRSQRTPMKEITTLDNPNELEEFMKQGEEACIGDMKTFITQFSLRQTTVAMMTGVSQPYISKLLNGNHRELSLRCRKNIYCWYLNCRRHPAKLSAFLADPSTRLETNCDGELIPQRRERYVFRPMLIRLLENFFAQTPFPDFSRRVEIATACNHVLQLDKKGVTLMPKEIVSPQVVSNWFANKRKELRKRSTAENTNNQNGGNGQQNNNNNSSTTDSVSISSMSPPSRDEEISSRNTTPETDCKLMPFDLSSSIVQSSSSPSSSDSSSSILPQVSSTSPSTVSTPLLPPNIDILAMAKCLGIQLPSSTTYPSTNSFLQQPSSYPFFPIQLLSSALQNDQQPSTVSTPPISFFPVIKSE